MNIECSKGLEQQKRTRDNETRPATNSPRSPRHAELQDEFQQRKLRSKESQVWRVARSAFMYRYTDSRWQTVEHFGRFWTMWHHRTWWNDGMMEWFNISLMPCKQISVPRGPWDTTLQLPGPKLRWFDEAQPWDFAHLNFVKCVYIEIYRYVHMYINVYYICFSVWMVLLHIFLKTCLKTSHALSK